MNEIIIVIIVAICTIIEYILSNKKDIYVGLFLGMMLSATFLASPFANHTVTKTYNLVVQEKDDYCSYYTAYTDSVYIIKNINGKEKEEYLNIDDVKIVNTSSKKAIVKIKYKISNSFFVKKEIISATIYDPGPFSKEITCTNCQTKNDWKANYCKECGKSLHLKTICKNCKMENDNDANYCEKCGEKLE